MTSKELTRRTILQTGAASLAGLSLAGPGAASDRRLERLGLQLYTLRSQLARDFDGTLARVAELGISEVEFAGYYDRTPSQVRAALDQNGLSAPAVHTLIGPLEKDLDRLLDECREIAEVHVATDDGGVVKSAEIPVETAKLTLRRFASAKLEGPKVRASRAAWSGEMPPMPRPKIPAVPISTAYGAGARKPSSITRCSCSTIRCPCRAWG